METGPPSRFAGRAAGTAFVLAAAGLALLGVRSAEAERDAAAREARGGLVARAREGAGLLDALAARLAGEAAAGGPGSASVREGRFLVPEEPVPLVPLAPVPGRDPQADFYLAVAGREEAADPESAAGLYRAAGARERDAESRALALFRLGALERRRGRAADAEAREREMLAVLPAERRGTLEAVIVRARARPPDPDLRGDLLRALGTPEDPVVLGLLRDAGLGDPAAVAARREALARRERLLPFLPAAAAAPSGVAARGDRVAAWSRRPDGLLALAEAPLPAAPPGVAYLPPGAASPDPPALAEEVAVASLPGWRARAAGDRAAVEAEGRRRVSLVAGALAVLLAGGGAALLLALRAARRESEAAGARAEFVQRVGHELRTPLSLVRMYAETIASGRVADAAQAREFAAVAARESERLSRMVETVLDFSRASSGGAGPRRRVDLARLAREAAEAHAPLFARAGLRLDVEAGEAPLPVAGDEDALRGALGSLLENVLQHAAAGGEATVRASKEGGRAVVRVLDRGPGLPAGAEGRVFGRFFRGPDAAGRGVGLGLALVREVAAAHGGEARAEAREGGGACLVLSFPRAEGEA